MNRHLNLSAFVLCLFLSAGCRLKALIVAMARAVETVVFHDVCWVGKGVWVGMGVGGEDTVFRRWEGFSLLAREKKERETNEGKEVHAMHRGVFFSEILS